MSRACRYSLEKLPCRPIVETGVVHRVISRVHPGTDSDVLRDGREVPEITLHVVVGGGRDNVIVISTSTTGEDATSGCVNVDCRRVVGVWVVDVGLADFRWMSGQVYIAGFGEGVQQPRQE